MPAGARVASIRSRTSRLAATDSNAETSWATSFVSPSLWSTRPFTIRIRSATQSSAAAA